MPFPRWLVLLSLLLVAPAAAERARYEPHLHGGGAVRGRALLELARTKGDLAAGLRALGLDGVPERRAIRAALQKIKVTSPRHHDTYRALGAFRRAAFAGPKYAAWVRATAEAVRRNAHESYVEISLSEIEAFVAAARADKIPLDGIGLLAGVGREGLPPELARALAHSEVAGIDIRGPEVAEQDLAALDGAVSLLLATDKPQPVLRIHAGEGYLGQHGEHNVNRVLAALAQRARRTDLSRLRIILGHAARIADVPAASRDLRELAAAGVRVEVNVNPLSNLVYGAVSDLKDIAALALAGIDLVPGSDNVGSTARNARILRLLQDGRVEEAQRLVGRRGR